MEEVRKVDPISEWDFEIPVVRCNPKATSLKSRKFPRLYLAGKISKNDWRHPLVPALRSARWEDGPIRTPDYAYVGPFFVGCDHGCAHGPNTHGAVIAEDHAICTTGSDKSEVIRRNVAALADANLVFAYITAKDCYGTLFELGMAAALGKRVVICFAPDIAPDDFWFVNGQANSVYETVNVCCLKSLLFAEIRILLAERVGNR